VVLDRGQLGAGRVHALEIGERGDRLRIARGAEVRVGDLQLRLLGTRVERVLVEERLVLLDRVLVRFLVERRRRLAPQLLGGHLGLATGAARGEGEGEECDRHQGSLHRGRR
jgi:hypothetical protein